MLYSYGAPKDGAPKDGAPLGGKHSRKRRHSMSKAPSTLTAAVMLAVFLCLGLTHACDQKICLEDPTCSGEWVECGTPNGNCASYAFNAACTGEYNLHVEVSSCQSGCHDCEVCAMVTKVPSGIVVGYCSSVCSNQDCNDDCKVNLVQGEAYFLWVCKMPCDGTDCEDCTSTGCKAFGCLCIAHTSCTP